MNESLARKNPPTRSPAHDDATERDILAAILAASNDACWCMEFGQPVDLTVPDDEIVRQVFENAPYWRLTNPAMARLYRLDPALDFNSRPPSEIFPRNPRNEEYVLNLIANGFEVDAAPALDRSYEGVELYVENDARAHIRNGRLLRMFGFVRDVGKHRHRETEIRNVLDDHVDILMALPSGVIATDPQGVITEANPAAGRLLDMQPGDLLGRSLETMLTSGPVRSVLAGEAPVEIEALGLRWCLNTLSRGGIVASILPLSTWEAQHG